MEGRIIIFNGSWDSSQGGRSKIEEYYQFTPDSLANVHKHEIHSAGLKLLIIPIVKGFLTFEKAGYG